MHQTPLNRDQDLPNGAVATTVNAHFPVALQLGQPVPTETAQPFEIEQSTVPTIEGVWGG
jgi:hypothetical protein